MPIGMLMADEGEREKGKVGRVQWRTIRVMPTQDAAYGMGQPVAMAQERFSPPLSNVTDACQVKIAIPRFFGGQLQHQEMGIEAGARDGTTNVARNVPGVPLRKGERRTQPARHPVRKFFFESLPRQLLGLLVRVIVG